MNNKYLSDGRKVAVIGKLNNNETIVQEVFVTKSGDEIPSGENFTVKSLHNEPVLSWKEKNLSNIEINTKNYILAQENANKDKSRAIQELKGIQELLKQSKLLEKLLPEQDLEVFTMFMTGTIEYLVVDSYGISPPEKMIDKIIGFNSYHSDSRFDSIKLLSVLGKSDGILDYRINQYSDGSGSNIHCYPFSNREDALSHIKQIALSKIENGRISAKDYIACIDMGIVFNKEEEGKYKKLMRKLIKSNIKNQKVTLDKSQKIMDDYTKQLEEL